MPNLDNEKPTIRVGFIDYYNPIDEYFIDQLSKTFTVIRDDENPEYLFFCDETFGTNNVKFNNRPEVTKIFYTGENRRPWNYTAHFYVSFDHLIADNHYRLPLYEVEKWVLENKLGLPKWKPFGKKILSPYVDPEPKRAKDRKFCSFVVSNGGSEMRNNAFKMINEYKPVDSAGPWLNTTGYVLPKGFDGIKQKLDFLSGYKFNICYENSSYPGYVTEKIFHALYAGTMPIYWGSPTIDLDFNTSRMISRHAFTSDAEMLEYIQYLDQDDKLYNFTIDALYDYHGLGNVTRVTNNSMPLGFAYWFRDMVYKK